MTYLARGTLALGLSLTMLATFISPFATPFIMQICAGQLIKGDTDGAAEAVAHLDHAVHRHRGGARQAHPDEHLDECVGVYLAAVTSAAALASAPRSASGMLRTPGRPASASGNPRIP